MRDEIACALRPISPRYLRELLRASGAPLDPLVEGVRQDSLTNLERTLTALAEAYGEARLCGDRRVQGACRQLVIEAKDHARYAAGRKASGSKDEMISWMLVWLDNPDVFPAWARLRKRALEQNLEERES